MNRFISPLKQNRGFTLIEIVVVVSITSLLLLMISAVYANVVQNNVNATITNDVRENGQFMMETMVRTIRGADSVSVNGSVPSTTTTTTAVTLSSIGNQTTFTLSTDNNLYMTNSGNSAGATTQLNSSFIQLGAASSFTVVPASGTAPARVIINLLLNKAAPSNLHKEYGSAQSYTQMVELRKYVR